MEFINYIEGKGADGLFVDSTTPPTPGEEEVLVKVKAFGLNRADLLQCAGHYPPPPGASPILGLECSGIVQAVGQQVKKWKVGDSVYGLVDGGAYANLCAMDTGMIWRKPPNLSWGKAAAIPEAFLTAYQALFSLMDVTQMQNILIHAAASGVGSAAIQLIRDLKVTAWGTVSGAKIPYCYEQGYDKLINYKEHSFLAKVLEGTEGEGVDGILDFIGGTHFQDNIRALAKDGILVMLGTLGGVKADSINVFPIIGQRLTIKGSTLRSRDKKYKRDLVTSFLDRFEEKIQEGNIQPSIYCELNWREVGKAHKWMKENKNTGKIVLLVE